MPSCPYCQEKITRSNIAFSFRTDAEEVKFFCPRCARSLFTNAVAFEKFLKERKKKI